MATPASEYEDGREQGAVMAEDDLHDYRMRRRLQSAYDRDIASPMAYPHVGKIAETRYSGVHSTWWKEGFQAGYWNEVNHEFRARQVRQTPIGKLRVKPYIVWR